LTPGGEDGGDAVKWGTAPNADANSIPPFIIIIIIVLFISLSIDQYVNIIPLDLHHRHHIIITTA
jgi:hypothetical protein